MDPGGGSAARGTADSATELEPRPAEHDWVVIERIRNVLGGQEVRRLRSNDFATPWLDGHVQPVVDLWSLVEAVIEQPFEPDVRDALRALADALNAFLGFYSARTFPDPSLIGEEWRFFQWDAPSAPGTGSVDSDLGGDLPAHLQKLTADVLDAYQTFNAITSGEPRAGSRKRARVSKGGKPG